MPNLQQLLATVNANPRGCNQYGCKSGSSSLTPDVLKTEAGALSKTAEEASQKVKRVRKDKHQAHRLAARAHSEAADAHFKTAQTLKGYDVASPPELDTPAVREGVKRYWAHMAAGAHHQRRSVFHADRQNRPVKYPPVGNANPRGCNQHKSCGGGDDETPEEKEALKGAEAMGVAPENAVGTAAHRRKWMGKLAAYGLSAESATKVFKAAMETRRAFGNFGEAIKAHVGTEQGVLSAPKPKRRGKAKWDT